MRKLAISGLAAAAVVLGGIASVATAPTSSASPTSSSATNVLLPPPSLRQQLHQQELSGASAHNVRSAAVTPAADPTTYNGLNDVSCYSRTMCLSVGYDLSGVTPVADVFNGGGWSDATDGGLPVSSGTAWSYLQSVSCPSATMCVSVGGYNTSDSTGTFNNGAGLAEIWNGSSWTHYTGLTNTGIYTGLEGVSCVSTKACLAVGTVSPDGVSGTPAAAIWNGSAWKRIPAPTIVGKAFMTEMTDVSCWAATSCVAVGYYTTGTPNSPTGTGPLAEKWNGSTWTVVRPPAIGLGSWLNGVDCKNSAFCVVAGGYFKTGTHRVGFAEKWRGGSLWTPYLSQSLANQGQSELRSVSCASTTDCDAVGYEQFNPTSVYPQLGKAAAVKWNGSSLTLTSPAAISGEDDEALGVSCKAASFCSAVGTYGPANTYYGADVSWFWNNTKWKLVAAA